MHQRCHRHEKELASSESRRNYGSCCRKGTFPAQSVKSVITEISCAHGETHAAWFRMELPDQLHLHAKTDGSGRDLLSHSHLA